MWANRRSFDCGRVATFAQDDSFRDARDDGFRDARHDSFRDARDDSFREGLGGYYSIGML
jgi:hypothetical protein